MSHPVESDSAKVRSLPQKLHPGSGSLRAHHWTAQTSTPAGPPGTDREKSLDSSDNSGSPALIASTRLSAFSTARHEHVLLRAYCRFKRQLSVLPNSMPRP